jgi:hypothetical protein
VGLTFEDTLLGNIHMDEKRAVRTNAGQVSEMPTSRPSEIIDSRCNRHKNESNYHVYEQTGNVYGDTAGLH